MQIKKEILADSLFPPSETLCFPESADLPDIERDGEDVETIEYRGYKQYINPLIFQNTPVQVVEDVSDDIDDIYVYEVPQKADLSNCKGKRPWCKASVQTSVSCNFKLSAQCACCRNYDTNFVKIEYRKNVAESAGVWKLKY